MKHEIKRTYRYRIYPNQEQHRTLAMTFGCSRWVYNWALDMKSSAYFDDGESVGFAEMSRRLTEKKREEETQWLQEVSAVPLQQSLRNLNQAFTNFFEGRAEYPSFKSKKRSNQTARYVGSAFDLREEKETGKTKLRLSKMPGLIRVNFSRGLPSSPSSCTVTKNSAGQYHVCFVCTEEVETLPKVKEDLKFVGVDLGLNHITVTSDGQKWGNPRWYEEEYHNLRRQQKKLSRKEKGSNNWERQRKKVARIHQRIQDRRKDFIEKLSTHLVKENDVIVVETLAVKNMQQNRHLSRAIGSAGWRTLTQRLEDKCEWYGRTLVKADRWFPSSKRCSACHHRKEDMPLSVREWACPECGIIHDRDINAAKNLSRVGQTRINAPGDLDKTDAFTVVGTDR